MSTQSKNNQTSLSARKHEWPCQNFACDWLRRWRVFSKPMADLSKQMQLWIPFDTQLTNFLDLLNQSHENPILTPRFLALDAD